MAVKQPEPAFVLAEPFTERIERLLRELRLAIKFKRPAILFAVYRSDLVRAEADAKLARKLTDLGQRVVRIQVSQTGYDVPAMLADYPNRENTVFFVRNLRWGENEGREAYRALNIRREYFVDERLHVVFWLTETELRDLAIFATDFWAFRHRSVEFFDRAEPDHFEQHASRLAWEAWGDGQFTENTNEKIELREKLLAELPETEETRYQKAELYYALAPLYRENDNLRKALACNNLALETANLLQDKHLQAICLNNRGLTYQKQGQFDNALADYDRAIQINPEDATAYNNRGNTYDDLGQFDNALADYDRAIQLNPEYATAYNNRGLTYDDLGQFDNALADYDRAIQLNPEYATAFYNRGLTYADLGQFDNALADYDRAIQLNPEDATAYNNRGLTYQKQGQFDNALADYDRAIQLNPEDAGYYNSLGTAYNALEKLDDALLAYQRAIELNPNFPYSHNNIASIYTKKELWKKAQFHLQKRIEIQPETALNAYVELGIITRHAGEIEESDQYFREAVDNWKQAWKMKLQSKAALLENRAIALLCLGEKEEAFNNLQAALENRLPGDNFELTSYRLLAESSYPPDGIEEMIAFLQKYGDLKDKK